MSVRSFAIATPLHDDSAQERDGNAARLVAAMDGTVLYANAICMTMAGGMALVGQNLLNIAQFIDTDEAFRHSSLLFASGDEIFTALRSGEHEIIFTRTGTRANLQFDIVKSRDGTKYVIASALEHDEALSLHVDRLIRKADFYSEEAAAHFLDLSADLLCIAGNDGTFESVNAIFTDTLGYTLSDMKDRSFLDLVHPDDKAAVRTAMQAVLRSASETAAVDFECRLVSNTAQSYWISWKHRRSGGKLYSVGRDITAAKKHEQALIRRERQLAEAEAIGRIGHWHWNIGQQDLRFSDEIYRIFGVTRADFRPTLDSVGARLHRRDAERMMQAFQRAIIEQNDHEIDFRVLVQNGETRHVKCQGRCQFDESGDVIGLYGIMQDITHIVAHEHALTEAKDAAERAYAAKSQFLANMSHELRTPLNAIIGFSEMMQQQLLGPIGNERYLDYIKGINESGEHLLDLISDILDMSKIEAGKYELDLETVTAAKVIRMAVHMVEGRAVDAGIKINLHMPDETLTLNADRRALTQIILNLLSNAVKFSRPNGQVDVECAAAGQFITMQVKDRGIGIPANKLATITNPFEQAANEYTRNHEGTGLGLSITKELTELHGGSIRIESTVDVGTTVTIRMPIDAVKSRRAAR